MTWSEIEFDDLPGDVAVVVHDIAEHLGVSVPALRLDSMEDEFYGWVFTVRHYTTPWAVTYERAFASRDVVTGVSVAARSGQMLEIWQTGLYEAEATTMGDKAMTVSDADMRVEVIRTLDGRESEFDVDGIVRALVDTYGTVPVGTVPTMAYWDLVARFDMSEDEADDRCRCSHPECGAC